MSLGTLIQVQSYLVAWSLLLCLRRLSPVAPKHNYTMRKDKGYWLLESLINIINTQISMSKAVTKFLLLNTTFRLVTTYTCITRYAVDSGYTNSRQALPAFWLATHWERYFWKQFENLSWKSIIHWESLNDLPNVIIVCHYNVGRCRKSADADMFSPYQSMPRRSQSVPKVALESSGTGHKVNGTEFAFAN